MKDRKSDYVCIECGKKYGESSTPSIVTFSQDECGICGKNKPVTHIKAYNYLRKKAS
jgi:DNA-directed RNA polymerase subunit RPC12/RpoP